jgi:hypothetical protein
VCFYGHFDHDKLHFAFRERCAVMPIHVCMSAKENFIADHSVYGRKKNNRLDCAAMVCQIFLNYTGDL